MRRLKPFAFVALLLALSLPASIAQGQGAKPTADAAAEGEPPPEPAPKVEVIPVGEVAVRSERAKRELGEAREKLASGEVLAEGLEEVAALSARFEVQHEASERMLSYGTSTSAIDQAALDRSILETALDTLQAKLKARGDEVDKARADVAEAAKVWQATRAASTTAETSKAVLAQIDVVIAAAASADEQGKELQGRIVELQSKVAQMTEQLQADGNSLDDLRHELVGQVFQRDKTPIWRTDELEIVGLDEILDRFRDAHAKDRAIVLTYTEQNAERLGVHVALFLLLIVVLLVGRRRRMGVGPLQVSDAGRTILRHPVSISALLILLATAWTFPDSPRPLNDLRSLLLIIPSVILLRRFLAPAAHGFLYAVMSLWVLDRVRDFLNTIPDLPRLMVSIEMVYLVVLTAGALQGGRIARVLADSGLPRWSGTAIILSQIALVGAISGLVAELAGYHVLATIIASAISFAPVGAVVFWGAVRAIDGLIDIALTARPLRFLGMVRHHQNEMRARILRVIGLLAALWWCSIALERLQIDKAAWAEIVDIVTTKLTVGEVSISLGDILLFAFTIWLSFRLSQFLRFVLAEDLYPRLELKKGQPYAFSTLTHYAIITFGVLIAVLASGFDFDRLSIMLGALSVGIGFGLQTAVNNFVSGLILLTERPVEVGDTIALGDVFGEVEQIGLRSTIVRTWQGAEVVVPNGDLISEQVTNWTHSDRRRRLEIPVHVEYGTDPQKVTDTLLAVARANDQLLEDPGPFVLMIGFGESAMQFELRAWTDQFDSYLTVKSRLTQSIVPALAAAGIRVPLPQHVVHVQSRQPEPG